MDRVALDTTFLIDLQNERRQGGSKWGALDFLRTHEETEFLLPVVALGEYLEGFDDPDSPRARALVSNISVLDVTAAVGRIYASVVRQLRRRGQMIGANDLWIACCARSADVPIVTRNVSEFRRVPKLEVIDY